MVALVWGLLGRLSGGRGAKPLDGVLDSLTALPKAGPQIALTFEPSEDRLYVERFRLQIRAQFVDLHGSGDGRLRKGADRIGRGERSAEGVLRDVDQHLTGTALGHDALVRDQAGMLGGNKLREDFSEHAQLLEGVDAFDGQVEVKSGGARGLQKYVQSDLA